MKFIILLIVLIGLSLSAAWQIKSRAHRASSTSLHAVNNAKRIPNIAAAILGAAMLVGPNMDVANAASYGGFGRGGSAVLDPKTAVVDQELAKSDDFKAGLKGVAELKDVVTSIEAALSKDSQLDVAVAGKPIFNIAKVRETLNKYNSVFGEDTQRGTDRLIRGFIQDITELERESLVKPGKQRSDVKVQAIQKRLAAAESALSDLQAFYKN